MFGLRIPVAELRDGENSYVRVSKPEEFGLEYPDVIFPSPVETRIEIFRFGLEITANVTVHTRLKMNCARCLNSFVDDFDSSFVVQVQLSRGGPAIADFADEDFAPLDATNGLIDLTDRVRAEIILELPRIPLCRQDCEGVRYDEKKIEVIDERWEPLKKLSAEKKTKKKSNKER